MGLTAENAASAAPVWGVIAEARSQRFTGTVSVGAAPRVTVWCRDGHVYLVERDDDAAVQTRLVTSGLVSPEDLAHGVMLVEGRVSLGRLFQRVPRLDRAQVVGALQRWNDATLDAIADLSADPVEREAGVIHPADIDDWVTPSTPLLAAPLLAAPSHSAPSLTAPRLAEQAAPVVPILPLPHLPAAQPVIALAAAPQPPLIPPPADDIASRIWRMVDAELTTKELS